MDTLGKQLSDTTKLVSIMLANNEIGTIQPIKALAEIVHNNGSYFHSDAVQAIGHIPVDVKDLGVDLLSASAHKFYGPKGIGFLYIREGTDILPFVDGGSQERGFRAGTENVASIVGMAIALVNCLSRIRTEMIRLSSLTKRFLEELDKSDIDYIVNGDLCNRLPGNINISIKNANGEMLLHRLDLKGIYIATASACNSSQKKTSHVIEAIKVPRDYSEGTIRLSLGKDNTLEDSITIAHEIIDITRNKRVNRQHNRYD